MPWPVRGQKAPNFWDGILKDYIDSADAANALSATAALEASEDALEAAESAQGTADAAEAGASAANAAVAAHAARTDNPHATTKSQVGLGNVDNTSDASKPASTAVQVLLDLKAPLASPSLTGTPLAPTPSTADSTTKIATTAFVKAQGYAPLASPALTGNPTGTTQSSGDNSTRLATTAFVKAQGYAPLVSPSFSGAVLAPTETVDSNNTRVATTAFVKAASGPLDASGTELRESFTGMANGTPPAISATRQAMTNFSFYGGAAPTVRSGYLSTATTASAQAGSYRIGQTSGPALRIGARFAFTPYSAPGGLMCLSIQATSIASKSEGQVPVSPMHLQITPTTWSLDVNPVDNGSVITVASGTFDTPLVADGATLHTVEVVLDRDRQQCFVTFPDGLTLVFYDSRFALAGTFVYVEPFKTAGSLSTKTDALIKEWWADSRAVEALPQMRRGAVTQWYNPVSRNAWVDSGGTNQNHRYRRQGDMVRIEGVIKSGAIGTSCQTLPAGSGFLPTFRPKAAHQFGTVSNSLFGAFVVNPDGTVVVYVGNNAFVGIDCEFPVT